jgi:hypothetical protein
VVAAAAVVAEAAEVAEVADAEVAAELAAEAAARHGELAAGAKPDRFPISLTNTRHHGRVRQNRPGQSMSSLAKLLGEYALRRRAGAADKIRVLRS